MMPAPAPDTGVIRINIVDGTRQPLAANKDSLVRILNGRKQQIAAPWITGSTKSFAVPFNDNLDDRYTVFVHSKGYNDGAIYPVIVSRGGIIDANIMLLPGDGEFHFRNWADVQKIDPRIRQLLTNGATDAQRRYSDTVEARSRELGALLTIGTAIRDIPLDDQTSPLNYYWEVMWDYLAPDRFWAWAEVGLADRIAKMSGAFAPEADAARWHPGVGNITPATRSWKQTRFDVTNVQLTFHENDKAERIDSNGRRVQCVVAEPDIDYYKDLLAHGLLEVLPNAITKGKTDPRMVYSLRWMATLQEGLPVFDPPCTIE